MTNSTKKTLFDIYNIWQFYWNVQHRSFNFTIRRQVSFPSDLQQMLQFSFFLNNKIQNNSKNYIYIYMYNNYISHKNIASKPCIEKIIQQINMNDLYIYQYTVCVK